MRRVKIQPPLTPGFRIEGFNVYTEFIPNRRITEKSSSSFDGDWTYPFEPEGSGMQPTTESHPRSFWRIPPLKELAEWMRARNAERILSELKAQMEAPASEPAARRAAS